LTLLQMGGPVLWIILAFGLLAFIVFLERSLHLHRARIRYEDFLEGIFNILKRQNVQEALSICEDTPGPVAYLVKTAILHRADDKAEVQTAVKNASAAEISRLERRLVVIATVAQIAPLLGLLGTVINLVGGLVVMQEQAPLIQTGDVSAGLMQALITTGAGLMVAIPCYVAFNLLVIKVDRIVLDMERAASEIVGFVAAGANGGDAHASAG
jgi:biopolymer transport protein ExbB